MNNKTTLKFISQTWFILLIGIYFPVNLNSQIIDNKKLDTEIERLKPQENILRKSSKKPSKPVAGRLCKCQNNIIQNGGFSTHNSTTNKAQSITSNNLVPPWDRGTNTPEFSPGNGYTTPGLAVMWGNKSLSESIKQKVPLKKGKKYKGCFAFRCALGPPENPSKHIRFKLLASKTSTLGTPLCPSGDCKLITISQTIELSDGWQVHHFIWEADDNYDYLFVTPENDETSLKGEYFSHGWFDDLCIEELGKEYDVPICCPPMDGELLSDLFNIVLIESGMNSPYIIQFNNSPYFKALWQAYTDYITVVSPCIEDLAMHLRLIDAGTDTTPNDVYSPMVSPSSQTWIWFKEGEGGNIFGNTNVFSDELEINHWYKIHAGIYTVPCNVYQGKDCPIHEFFFRIQVQKGRKMGQISNGRKILKQFDFEKK